MSTLQNRLRRFINYLDLSMRAFEYQCNIKAGTASKMSEKSYSTTFHKIQQAFPQLNIDWLMTGEGEMLLQDDGTPQITATITGNNNHIAGHDLNNAETARLLQLLHAQSQQLDKAQSQIDRLLSIIEKLSK